MEAQSVYEIAPGTGCHENVTVFVETVEWYAGSFRFAFVPVQYTPRKTS
jgi:hypothetical protein